MQTPNSILIGKFIYYILSNDEYIKTKVENKISPIIADEDTTFPFIVYNRSGIIPEYTKCGICEDNVTVEINVVSDDYYESCEIANKVRNILESTKKYTYDDMYIDSIKLSSSSETFSEFIYVQILSFQIKIS